VCGPLISPDELGRQNGREAAQLLRDALRLSLRRGAGRFRGAGKINPMEFAVYYGFLWVLRDYFMRVSYYRERRQRPRGA
jgi:hypothetical protein